MDAIFSNPNQSKTLASHTMESVEAKLNRLSSAKVLVVGDVMLDQYWFGAVDRVSPEAPVPIIKVDKTEYRLGGAGNVASNIASLGGQATLLGIVGDDESGKQLYSLAAKSNITPDLQKDALVETTVKLRIMARNQQLLRADFEKEPESAVVDQILDRYESLITSHDAVVLSDYGKGVLGPVSKMISIANQSNKPVLIDPKGRDFTPYANATLITPNLKELALAAGDVEDEDTISNKSVDMVQRLGLKALLVTMSDKGMTLYPALGDAIHRSARAQEVYDVSGAGDTVIAVMAMALATELQWSDAVDTANAAAGVVVSKLGTATINQDELRSALTRNEVS